MPEIVDGSQLYLRCMDCGEVFDSMATAYQFHGGDTGFEIVKEEEAF